MGRTQHKFSREWPRYCREVYWTKMVQNGPNDHFGQNDLIPNWISAFARPKWTKMVHFGLKRTILVHSDPPTVLWPFLIFTAQRGTYRVSSSETTTIHSSHSCSSEIRKHPHAHKNKIGTSTPLSKTATPPPQIKTFMGMGVFLQKEPKMPSAHKIGAAISGPRIAGGTNYGREAFSEKWSNG